MTPDGIEDADWDRIHALAVDIVSHSAREEEAEEARARALLLALLDDLDRKYGPRPSLLATRADYVESSEHRERLLRIAYAEAERLADDSNRQLIAHSLTEFYIEEVHNFDEGATWLGTWRDQLGIAPNRHDRAEVSRLERLLLKGGAV
jgi:hypothetical protein